MLELLKNFHEKVASKRTFWIPLLMFSVVSYGFSMMNRTVSIDDLRCKFYNDPNIWGISGGRWGSTLFMNLLGVENFSPFIGKFLAGVFFCLTAIVICCIFYHLNGESEAVLPYTVFSCVMVTFPLVHEIWEYYGAFLLIALTMLISSCVVLKMLLEGKKSLRVYVLASIAMSLVVSSYEVSIFGYIALVCIVIFYRYCIHNSNHKIGWGWIPEGLCYTIPLMAGIVIRAVVEIILLQIYQVEYDPIGQTQIGFGACFHLQNLIDLIGAYGLTGLIYFPIGIFVAAAAIFVVFMVARSIRMRSGFPFLLGLVVFFGVFIQYFIQGVPMPYRNALTLSLFVAFVALLLTEKGLKANKKWIYPGICGCLLFLCWHQSVYLNQMLEANNLRSDNEFAIVRNIGYELVAEYESRPVAFVGNAFHLPGSWFTQYTTDSGESLGGSIYAKSVDVGNRILSAMGRDERFALNYRYVQTNLNSSLTWSRSMEHMMQEYFAYCGYDFDVIDPRTQPQLHEQLSQIAKENGLGTYSIMDTGEYLIVNLG